MMQFYEIIGWIGSFLFAVCAIPQVIHTYRTKKTDGLSMVFLLFWFFGEVLSLFYIFYADMLEQVWHLPLYFNYIFNMLLVVYLIYAKIHYKKRRNNSKRK